MHILEMVSLRRDRKIAGCIARKGDRLTGPCIIICAVRPKQVPRRPQLAALDVARAVAREVGPG
jgi:hypothetical protein